MSFAAKSSQNRSQEWNLGATKHRQSNGSAIIGPKTANFGPKVVFLVIFGQILVFLAHLAPCPTKKEKPWWLSLWWSTKTFLTKINKDIVPYNNIKQSIWKVFWYWFLLSTRKLKVETQVIARRLWTIKIFQVQWFSQRKWFINWFGIVLKIRYYYRECSFDGHVAHDG